MKVLLAEDDRRIANFVIKGLRENARRLLSKCRALAGRHSAYCNYGRLSKSQSVRLEKV